MIKVVFQDNSRMLVKKKIVWGLAIWICTPKNKREKSQRNKEANKTGNCNKSILTAKHARGNLLIFRIPINLKINRGVQINILSNMIHQVNMTDLKIVDINLKVRKRYKSNSDSHLPTYIFSRLVKVTG